MKPQDLKRGRLNRGWSQQATARCLNLSQSYVAMLENGERQFTPHLARKVASLFKLPPTVLPHSGLLEKKGKKETAQSLAEQLATLGYPGFSYLRPRGRKRNPNDVLLSALAQPELESRLVEALPWVLVAYPNMDTNWLVPQAKQRDLQNRLGFVATLAREVAEKKFPDRVQALRDLENRLDDSRLAKEDTLCNLTMSEAEKNWLRENRPPEAVRWNLLTDWRAGTLSYDA